MRPARQCRPIPVGLPVIPPGYDPWHGRLFLAEATGPAIPPAADLARESRYWCAASVPHSPKAGVQGPAETVTPDPDSGEREPRRLPGLRHRPGACLSRDLGWRLRPGWRASVRFGPAGHGRMVPGDGGEVLDGPAAAGGVLTHANLVGGDVRCVSRAVSW